MVFCTICGTEWPNNVHYCGKCGTSLLEEPDTVTKETTELQDYIAINNTVDRGSISWNEITSPINLFLKFSAGAVLFITASIICLIVILIATAESGDNWMWAKIMTILVSLISIYTISVMPENTGKISNSQKTNSIWVIIIIAILILIYL